VLQIAGAASKQERERELSVAEKLLAQRNLQVSLSLCCHTCLPVSLPSAPYPRTLPPL
jgi:hypothetical protein